MLKYPLSYLLFLCLTIHTYTQDFSKVQIKTVKINDSLYMLMGAGGNLGVSVGEDGVLLVDDQYAPMHDKIVTAIRKICDKPVRFVVNTHWHGDHTEGNEAFGKEGAIIVAHNNVRKHMSSEQFIKYFQMYSPASPTMALPTITFSDTISFYWNNEEVRVIHLANAHTDGDSVIYFTKANVIHMGDIYFNGFYPFIDVPHGGSIFGIVKAIDTVLDLIDDKTQIIPGHGPLSNKKELKSYRDMLEAIGNNVKKIADQGNTLAQTQTQKPTSDFDTTWGKGFLLPDIFVEIVYDSVKQ